MTQRLALVLAAVALLAQAPPPGRGGASAADRYHQGAQAFIDGDNARALQAVDEGLRRAPDDARLRALRDLIEQQQEGQDNQDGGQQDPADNSDANDDGQEGEQGQDGQQPPPEQNEGGPEAEQDQTRTAPPSQGGSGDDMREMPARPGEMSRAQAEQILDAVGGEERLLLRELRRAPTQRRRSDKDW